MMENSADDSPQPPDPDRFGLMGVLAVLIGFGIYASILVVAGGPSSERPANASTPDTPDTSDAPDPTLTVVRYVPQATNVRAGRSTETEVVTTLARGDTVRTEERRDGWARVYPYGDGADTVLGYVYVDLLADSPPPAPEPSTAQDETQESQEPQFNADYYLGDAAYICEDFVEDQLRAPSTAEYPWSAFGTRARSFATYEGEYTYRVRAHVDAENAFGAKVRTQFNCRVEYRGNYTFRLVDLSTW